MRRLITIIIVISKLLALIPVARAQDQQPTTPTAESLPTYTPYPTYTPWPTATAPVIAPDPAPPSPRSIDGLDNSLMERADLDLYTVQLQIERLQSQRVANRAELLQLPTTHALPPGELGAAPDPSRRVGLDSWYSAAIDLPLMMYASVRVDVYDGPQGVGYVLVATMVQRGEVWARRVNVGPETRRTRDWHLAPTDEAEK